MRRLLKILLLLPLTAQAGFQDVCDSIKALTPSISDIQLNKIAVSTYKLSQIYSIDWKIPVAIFKQESNFNHKAVNYTSRDFGLGQLHYKTILNRNVDLGELLTDPYYATEQTILILSELHEKYAKIDARAGRQWYTRYHSFTPSYRAIYRDALQKHLKVIEDVIRDKEEEKRNYGSSNDQPTSRRRTQEEDKGSVCNPR